MNNIVFQNQEYHDYPITFRKNAQTLRISIKTMSIMKYPKYVRILIKNNNSELIIQPCTINEKNSFQIKSTDLNKYSGFYIYSKLLISKIYYLNNWNINYSYKLNGKYISDKNSIIVKFIDAKIIIL